MRPSHHRRPDWRVSSVRLRDDALCRPVDLVMRNWRHGLQVRLTASSVSGSIWLQTSESRSRLRDAMRDSEPALRRRLTGAASPSPALRRARFAGGAAMTFDASGAAGAGMLAASAVRREGVSRTGLARARLRVERSNRRK